ncbi:hypothetical protein NE237_014770 [Protea cynaroides]|uniref:Uncharacterized protein n=1 Tax=Protea cynaroides TaxID=273540 RepID=A0A9Q0QQK9_9MAGN|nr:hypothetical protein NE237_014770 [Protea cynaroides]
MRRCFRSGEIGFFGRHRGSDFRCSIFDSSPGRQEQPENQNWNNGDGSTGTPSGEGLEGEEEDDDEDEDEEDEVDEVDGEVEGLVAVDDDNNKNNNNSSSDRGVLLKDGNGVQSEQQHRINHFENAVTIAELEMWPEKKMKPQHLPSDSSMVHEAKKTMGEKLKNVYDGAKVSLARKIASQKGNGDSVSQGIERRRASNSTTEDPIRTIMFLGSWNHT